MGDGRNYAKWNLRQNRDRLTNDFDSTSQRGKTERFITGR